MVIDTPEKKRFVILVYIIALVVCLLLVMLTINRAGGRLSSKLQPPEVAGLLEVGPSGISLYFQKTDKATGYELYRSYSQTIGYELVGEVMLQDGSDLSALSVTDADFDRERDTIYYKLRAYRIKEKDGRAIKTYSDFGQVIVARNGYELSLSDKIQDFRPSQKNELELSMGDKLTLKPYIGWRRIDRESLTWTSSDSSIFTVNKGKLKALASGRAQLRVTDPGSGRSLELTIVVLAEDR